MKATVAIGMGDDGKPVLYAVTASGEGIYLPRAHQHFLRAVCGLDGTTLGPRESKLISTDANSLADYLRWPVERVQQVADELAGLGVIELAFASQIRSA